MAIPLGLYDIHHTRYPILKSNISFQDNLYGIAKLDVVLLCETQKVIRYYLKDGWAWWVCLMGEWSVSQWVLGVIMFQIIFGFCDVEHFKVEKCSDSVCS